MGASHRMFGGDADVGNCLDPYMARVLWTRGVDGHSHEVDGGLGVRTVSVGGFACCPGCGEWRYLGVAGVALWLWAPGVGIRAFASAPADLLVAASALGIGSWFRQPWRLVACGCFRRLRSRWRFVPGFPGGRRGA